MRARGVRSSKSTTRLRNGWIGSATDNSTDTAEKSRRERDSPWLPGAIGADLAGEGLQATLLRSVNGRRRAHDSELSPLDILMRRDFKPFL